MDELAAPPTPAPSPAPTPADQPAAKVAIRGHVLALSALAGSLDTEQPRALVELRWLLEEYGVSLFAQELKTLVTVSSKRLDEAELAARRAVDVLR
jgi:ATP-dependent helicase HrpA